jgi:exodeoxyribonuclease-3
MKIISFNVNGINAAKKNGLLDFIEAEGADADILCLQEVKASEATIDPSLLEIAGYTFHPFYSQKKGHHGTACYTKVPPLNMANGIGEREADEEGRVITMEFDTFFLVNAYVPNAGRGLPRLDYKLKFNDLFLAYCEQLRQQKHVVICGDLNVAHTELDIANPKRNEMNAGFTAEERASFTKLLAAGYIDTFREFETEGGHYTWWSQRSDAKARNIGWRLDYFLVDREFRPAVTGCEILRDIDVADHCPIRLTIEA